MGSSLRMFSGKYSFSLDRLTYFASRIGSMMPTLCACWYTRSVKSCIGSVRSKLTAPSGFAFISSPKNQKVVNICTLESTSVAVVVVASNSDSGAGFLL